MNNILKLNGVEKAISGRKTSRIAPDEITDSDYIDGVEWLECLW